MIKVGDLRKHGLHAAVVVLMGRIGHGDGVDHDATAFIDGRDVPSGPPSAGPNDNDRVLGDLISALAIAGQKSFASGENGRQFRRDGPPALAKGFERLAQVVGAGEQFGHRVGLRHAVRQGLRRNRFERSLTVLCPRLADCPRREVIVGSIKPRVGVRHRVHQAPIDPHRGRPPRILTLKPDNVNLTRDPFALGLKRDVRHNPCVRPGDDWGKGPAAHLASHGDRMDEVLISLRRHRRRGLGKRRPDTKTRGKKCDVTHSKHHTRLLFSFLIFCAHVAHKNGYQSIIICVTVQAMSFHANVLPHVLHIHHVLGPRCDTRGLARPSCSRSS